MTFERTLVVPDDTPVGERLRLARVAARVSPLEVAAAIGVSLRTYQRIEDGSRNPRHVELVAIAQITNQDIAFFGDASLSPDDDAGLLTGGTAEVNVGTAS